MKFKAQEIVRGATRIAFKADNGDNIESGTVFVDVSLDKEGQGFGFRTTGMKCADLGVIDRIKHLPFPLRCELLIEQQAGAKTERLVVVDVIPLAQADGKPLPGQPKAA